MGEDSDTSEYVYHDCCKICDTYRVKTLQIAVVLLVVTFIAVVAAGSLCLRISSLQFQLNQLSQ